ncbi:MAG: exosome complex RNA-binding protein Csl4 [Nitrososphaerota archaeon]
MVFIRDGEVVVPGEPLCIQEEFSPGDNTSLDSRGRVIAKVLGIASYDKSTRTVSVKPMKAVQPFKVGGQVIAQVRSIQDKIAVVTILSAGGRALKHPKTAIIIPRKGMKEEMKDVVGVGDLVIAQVATQFMGIIGLSIWRPGLGVVLGVCDKCSSILSKAKMELICLKCGEKHKRKIVPFYGNMERIASMLEVMPG